MRHAKLKLFATFLVTAVTLFGVISPALAADWNSRTYMDNFNADTWNSKFNPGRIIDEGVFTDTSKMSAAEIQDFLEFMVPSGNCADKTSSSPCLRYYRNGDGERASTVIYKAGRDYDINPQVLLVTLQKENGMITDPNPESWEYRTAMGFACPDTAACDPSFYGFTKQVRQAARHYRGYFDDADGWVVPYTPGSRYVQYNPDSDCGGKTITIANRATAALYNYTPYQPNKAALNAGWSAAPPCGAYGNRNFWLYFNLYFGSPLSPSYTAQDAGRCCHFEDVPGTTKSVTLKFKNNGVTDWWDHSGHTSTSAPAGTLPVHLYTSNDLARDSRFAHSSWYTEDRPRRNFSRVLLADGVTVSGTEHRVRPGQFAEYTFTMQIPMGIEPNEYREYFQPSLFRKPTAFKGDPGSFIDVTVKKPVYESEVYKRCCHREALPGETENAELWFKNTGNMPWYDQTGVAGAPSGTAKVMLYTDNPLGRESPLGYYWGSGQDVPARDFTKVYESNGTTLAANQHKVAPGQIAKYDVRFVVPGTADDGRYRTYFRPSLFKQAGAFNDLDAFIDVNVGTARYKAEVVGRDSTFEITRGSTFTTYMRVKNTGNIPWFDKVSIADASPGYLPTIAGTANPLLHASRFGAAWGGGKDIAARTFTEVRNGDGTLATDQHTVQPGQTARINLTFTASSTQAKGTYREYVQLLGRRKIDGQYVHIPYSGSQTYFNVTVK